MKWKMNCVQQTNPEFCCKARALVIRRDDGSFYLYSETGEHNHCVNEAAITAEELKLRMIEIVKKDPSAPVGEAIKTVKKEMAEENGKN